MTTLPEGCVAANLQSKGKEAKEQHEGEKGSVISVTHEGENMTKDELKEWQDQCGKWKNPHVSATLHVEFEKIFFLVH